MVFLRITAAAAVVVVAGTAPAGAQALFTGMLTGHIGAARNGDVGDATTTGGLSMAVVDANLVGAEIDVGHTGAFDQRFFADSSVSSFMVNFLALYPHDSFRPFVNVGVGVLRVRASYVEGAAPEGQTQAGWNAGGGLFFVLNETLALRGDLRYFRLVQRPESLILRDSGFFDYWRTTIGATFMWPIR